MANKLREEDDLLTTVNYTSLLRLILRQLDQYNPFQFSSDNKRLKINVDTIARNIALSDEISLPASINKSDHCVSINFSDESEDSFPQEIRNIRDKLRDFLVKITPNNQSLEKSINKLLIDLTKWKNYQKNKGFEYAFSDINGIKKQRLTISNPEKIIPNNSSLKLHKLTIKVKNIKEFEQELKDSLRKNLSTNFSDVDSEIYEDLELTLHEFINYSDYRKNKQKSEIENLVDLVKNEAVGRLKKEAKIIYLEYILSQIDVNKNSDAIYLQDLIRRLRLLENYLNDKNKGEGDYIVNYEGLEVNYRDLFSRGEAYDMLPIIPLVEGYLGEETNESKGEKGFIFGLKLKLNGGVKNQGEKRESSSSLNYYLNLLNPESKQHQEELGKGESGKRKILKIALLFTFIFASRQDIDGEGYDINSELTYNPIESWEEKVLPILQSSDNEKKKNILRGIKQGIEKYKIETKVARLEKVLKSFLLKKSVIVPKVYPLQIGIRKNILKTSADKINEDGNFFQSTIKTKDSLKFLAIGEARINDDYLCHLRVTLTIDDIRYYPTQETHTLNLGYDLTGIKALPIMMLPLSDEKVNEFYQKEFQQHNLIIKEKKRLKNKIKRLFLNIQIHRKPFFIASFFRC
ncbi:hypothetical protein [Geminocystis sp. GBBB08]|uniref:hypothetical protein n=1 Tax=Geminocystis sp. GBBB08 TaxID=2604140 RepID=UPI0027E2CE51|nr:hypothetical protein [Geminocystis sp. GBBB08]